MRRIPPLIPLAVTALSLAAACAPLPSEATVTRSGGTPLTFGQTVYVTVIPFDAVSGGGNALPSIHLQGSYQTFSSTTKTVTAWPLWTLYAGAADLVVDVPNGFSAKNAGTFGGSVYAGSIIFPAGVTLTQMTANLYLNYTPSGSGYAFLSLLRLPASGYPTTTNLGSVQAPSNSGWQVLTLALSEAVAAGSTYLLYWTLVDDGVGGHNQGVGTLAFTYSMPDPSKSY